MEQEMTIDLDACLAELRRREVLPSDVRSVFVSGSQIKGWGNTASDLDIYVISDEAWTGRHVETASVRLDPSTVPVDAFYVGDCRWDIEYWQLRQIDQLIRSVSWSEYDSGALAMHPLTRHEIDVLEQLSYGRALLGEGWLAARKLELAESALRPHLIGQRLNLADVYVEDALGQLQAHDYECAVLSARLAFGHAADALTAYHGELGGNTKWRPKRFQAVSQSILSFEDYWRLESMQGYDPRHPTVWVKEVLEVYRLIAVKVTS
jgi:hypothetical protein